VFHVWFLTTSVIQFSEIELLGEWFHWYRC